jgi:hypothetical protein
MKGRAEAWPCNVFGIIVLLAIRLEYFQQAAIGDSFLG